MSKIIMEGFRTDATLDDIDAILVRNIFWYDIANTRLMVGSIALNYYIDNSDETKPKVLTTLTQAEAPGLTISPVEFSVLT